MISVLLTKREISTLEIAFSLSCEPPYSSGEDADHLDKIKEKLAQARIRANKKT